MLMDGSWQVEYLETGDRVEIALMEPNFFSSPWSRLDFRSIL